MIGGGLPRTPNLADRRAASRSAQVQHSPNGPQQAIRHEQPIAPHMHSQAPEAHKKTRKEHQESSGGKKIFWIILTILMVAIICGATWFMLKGGDKTIAGEQIDKAKYQTVFLVNGQEYFGNLEIIDDSYVKLTNVFYVRSNSEAKTQVDGNEDSQIVDGTTSNSQLIKLGDEINGPEDSMIINRDQVLFFVNMKPGAQVSKLIDQYKANGGN